MCKICELKPVYEFTNKRRICRACYLRWFQKKIFYTARKFEMLKSGDVISYKKGKGFRDAVLEDVLKLIVKDGRTKLTLRGRKNKFAVSDTTDLVSYEIMNGIISKSNLNLKNLMPVSEKVIRPLYFFLDQEVLLYARLKKLKFKGDLERKNKVSRFIDELEKKHPEVKRAIVNNFVNPS